jgi:hypothetical protein
MGFKPLQRLFSVDPSSLSKHTVPIREQSTYNFLLGCDSLANKPNKALPQLLSPDDASMAIALTHCRDLFGSGGLQVYPHQKKGWAEYWSLTQSKLTKKSDIVIGWEEPQLQYEPVITITKIGDTKVHYMVNISLFRSLKSAKDYINSRVANLLYTDRGKTYLDELFPKLSLESAYQQLKCIKFYM